MEHYKYITKDEYLAFGMDPTQDDKDYIRCIMAASSQIDWLTGSQIGADIDRAQFKPYKNNTADDVKQMVKWCTARVAQMEIDKGFKNLRGSASQSSGGQSTSQSNPSDPDFIHKAVLRDLETVGLSQRQSFENPTIAHGYSDLDDDCYTDDECECAFKDGVMVKNVRWDQKPDLTTVDNLIDTKVGDQVKLNTKTIQQNKDIMDKINADDVKDLPDMKATIKDNTLNINDTRIQSNDNKTEIEKLKNNPIKPELMFSEGKSDDTGQDYRKLNNFNNDSDITFKVGDNYDDYSGAEIDLGSFNDIRFKIRNEKVLGAVLIVEDTANNTTRKIEVDKILSYDRQYDGQNNLIGYNLENDSPDGNHVLGFDATNAGAGILIGNLLKKKGWRIVEIDDKLHFQKSDTDTNKNEIDLTLDYLDRLGQMVEGMLLNNKFVNLNPTVKFSSGVDNTQMIADIPISAFNGLKKQDLIGSSWNFEGETPKMSWSGMIAEHVHFATSTPITIGADSTTPWKNVILTNASEHPSPNGLQYIAFPYVTYIRIILKSPTPFEWITNNWDAPFIGLIRPVVAISNANVITKKIDDNVKDISDMKISISNNESAITGVSTNVQKNATDIANGKTDLQTFKDKTVREFTLQPGTAIRLLAPADWTYQALRITNGLASMDINFWTTDKDTEKLLFSWVNGQESVGGKEFFISYSGKELWLSNKGGSINTYRITSFGDITFTLDNITTNIGAPNGTDMTYYKPYWKELSLSEWQSYDLTHVPKINVYDSSGENITLRSSDVDPNGAFPNYQAFATDTTYSMPDHENIYHTTMHDNSTKTWKIEKVKVFIDKSYQRTSGW